MAMGNMSAMVIMQRMFEILSSSIPANRKLEEDAEMSINSMKYYRKLYNMEIIDSELNRQYGIYLNNLINRATSTTEEE